MSVIIKGKWNKLAFENIIFLLQFCLISVEAVPTVRIDGDQTQFVARGYGMLLTCQYHALPSVSEVQWKKDGTVIARNTSVEINDSRIIIPHFNDTHVQLTINATTSQDSGNYSCNVANDMGNSSDTTTILIEGMS